MHPTSIQQLSQKVNNEFNIIIKHSDKEGEHIEGDIELRYVGHDCSQINIAKDIYEYVLC